ncbi:hypothetical protein HANVADRAFT_61411 [Hanseniaspora valbyensis NRRL Y-1626]|uniref:LicD/FKTN/FKRP nucleotidyltransferase domain-containing protein n=1 Tax=Hanseniaspora valbyensis NRRL Y-1626 TaxID=766949 RepID=A0A1B7TH61_9ASCO|nr:hypothetical protein HANVADRAFT_61411 [Hanseniaspora valbyensis NRRL Y-1626]
MNSNYLQNLENHVISEQLYKLNNIKYNNFINKFGLKDFININSENNIYITKTNDIIKKMDTIKPKLIINDNVKKTHFGHQIGFKHINDKLSSKEDKSLYFTLKYYYWCTNNGIEYPIIPLNLKEWLPQNNFYSENGYVKLFLKNNFGNCAFETSKKNDGLDFKNDIGLDFRDIKESIKCKAKQGKYYLDHYDHFKPEKLVMLPNIFDKSKEKISAFISTRVINTKMDAVELLAKFLDEYDIFCMDTIYKDNDSKENIYYPIKELLTEINHTLSGKNDYNIPVIDQRINSIKKLTNQVILKNVDFRWNLKKQLKALLFKKGKFLNSKEPVTKYTKLVKKSFDKIESMMNILINTLPELSKQKYFHEVAIKSDIDHIWRGGTHYDWRFFQNLKPLSERYQILNEMYDAWSIFTKQDNIVSWLAHGNLLSWAWEGGQFLWDKDLDLQLPISHFTFLASNYNNTVFTYKNEENKVKLFYLDINPNYMDNYHGKMGLNVIDGRFIDMESGLYIDLTSLSFKNIEDETKPESENVLKNLKNTWIKPFIKNFENTDIKNKTNVIGDKNYHFYLNLDTISPLRKVKYGYLNSDAMVPSTINNILTEEYPKGLINKKYTDYNYNLKYHGWVKKCESFSEEIADRNCEGLPNEYFSEIKKHWLDHYHEETKRCNTTVFENTAYCKWFKQISQKSSYYSEIIPKTSSSFLFFFKKIYKSLINN